MDLAWSRTEDSLCIMDLDTNRFVSIYVDAQFMSPPKPYCIVDDAGLVTGANTAEETIAIVNNFFEKNEPGELPTLMAKLGYYTIGWTK